MAWGIGHGAWSMEHGAWSMEHGAWRVGHGAWGMEHGAWSMGHGEWGMEHGVKRERRENRDKERGIVHSRWEAAGSRQRSEARSRDLVAREWVGTRNLRLFKIRRRERLLSSESTILKRF